MFASTLTSGSTSAGNRTFLIRLPPAMSEPDGIRQRGRKPVPRQDAAEHEDCVRLHAWRFVRNDLREDERVDQQQQQRVDEGPEEAEHGAAIARLQVARHEAPDQPAVSNREVGIEDCAEQLRADSSATRDLQPDERLEQGDPRPLEVDVASSASRAALPRASWRLRRGPASISCRRLRDLRQDRDAIGLHFHEPECDREIVLFPVPGDTTARPPAAWRAAAYGRAARRDSPRSPGICTSSTCSFTSRRSAETICSCRCEGIGGIAIVR